jgi:hypothetical protein
MQPAPVQTQEAPQPDPKAETEELRGADDVAVALSSGKVAVRCASLERETGELFTRAQVAAMTRGKAVVVTVTPPVGASYTACPRLVPDKHTVHVVVPMDVPYPGEYRYVVTYAQRVSCEGVVLVYTRRGLEELRRLVRTVKFELTCESTASGALPDFALRPTDDGRTRAVLFRCAVRTTAGARALTRAELRLPEVRARVELAMDAVEVTLSGLPDKDTTEPNEVYSKMIRNATVKLTEALSWESFVTGAFDAETELTSPLAVSTRMASDAEKEPTSREVAEFEVMYLSREPTPPNQNGTYTVRYQGKKYGEASIRVETPLVPHPGCAVSVTLQRSTKPAALVLTCIDLHKKQRAGLERLMTHLGYEYDHEYTDVDGKKTIASVSNYDLVTIAGASLGVMGSTDEKMAGASATQSTLFRDLDAHWLKTVFDQITVSANLHATNQIIVVDHLGCGCYNEYHRDYGKSYHSADGARAVQRHFDSLRRFCRLIHEVYGGDGKSVSGYLLDETGDVVPIIAAIGTGVTYVHGKATYDGSAPVTYGPNDGKVQYNPPAVSTSVAQRNNKLNSAVWTAMLFAIQQTAAAALVTKGAVLQLPPFRWTAADAQRVCSDLLRKRRMEGGINYMRNQWRIEQARIRLESTQSRVNSYESALNKNWAGYHPYDLAKLKASRDRYKAYCEEVETSQTVFFATDAYVQEKEKKYWPQAVSIGPHYWPVGMGPPLQPAMENVNFWLEPFGVPRSEAHSKTEYRDPASAPNRYAGDNGPMLWEQFTVKFKVPYIITTAGLRDVKIPTEWNKPHKQSDFDAWP